MKDGKRQRLLLTPSLLDPQGCACSAIGSAGYAANTSQQARPRALGITCDVLSNRCGERILEDPTVNEMLERDLSELTDAEDFLEYFEISYDARVVDVSRLHILKRFHDYLKQVRPLGHETAVALQALYKSLLERAYQDFTHSSPSAEKVFEVFHRGRQQVVHIPVETLFK